MYPHTDWPFIIGFRQLLRARTARAARVRHARAGFLRVILGAALGAALFAMLLLTPAPSVGQEIPRAAQEHRRDLVRIWRQVWGLRAPTSTAAAQVHQESAWNPRALSRAGAQGLAQFMPATAAWIGTTDPALADVVPFDPRWALLAQARYMAFLHARTDGADSCERMAFALAAYNGGLGWVQRRKAVSPDPLRCLDATCEINPGITPANQRENAEYPRRILLRLEPVYYAHGWGRASCLA